MIKAKESQKIAGLLHANLSPKKEQLVNNRGNPWQKTGLLSFTFPGGGGYSANFHTGRLRPDVKPLTLLYTIFTKKATYPFGITSIDKWFPFTYLVKNFASLLTAVNAQCFK